MKYTGNHYNLSTGSTEEGDGMAVNFDQRKSTMLYHLPLTKSAKYENILLLCAESNNLKICLSLKLDVKRLFTEVVRHGQLIQELLSQGVVKPRTLTAR